MTLYYTLGQADSCIATGKATLPFFDKEGLKDSLKIQSFIFRRIGNAYEQKKDYRQALPYYQESLELIKKNTQYLPAEIARAYLHIGQMLNRVGDFHRAQTVLQKVLPVLHDLPNTYTGNVITAITYQEISNAYADAANYEKAKHYLLRAEPYYLNAFAKRPGILGNIYVRLGNLIGDMGESEVAIQYYQKALSLYRTSKYEATKQSGIATTLYNIAATYFDQERFVEAEMNCQKSLAIRREHFPEVQEDIANNLNLLANIKADTDSAELALPLYHQSLALRKKTYGDSSLLVARSYNNLGFSYTKLTQKDSALYYLNLALALKRNFYKKKHNDIALTLENFGTLYKQAQPDSAAYYYHQACSEMVESFQNHRLSANPNPEKAALPLPLMVYLQHKGQALYLAGKEKEALAAYAAAAASSRIALQKARREHDKIEVAETSQSMYEEAALLHFLRGK